MLSHEKQPLIRRNNSLKMASACFCEGSEHECQDVFFMGLYLRFIDVFFCIIYTQ